MEIKDKNMGKVEVMADKKELLSDEILQEVAAGSLLPSLKGEYRRCMLDCVTKGTQAAICVKMCR